jgi:aspartate racemase
MTLPSPLIGILGGMGPQAGLDLAEKLIRLTQTTRDQDHIPFILFSLPASVPDRTDFLLGNQDINPAHAIAGQFEEMAAMGVTIAAMACNTAHAGPIFDLVLELLRGKGIRLRILHMVAYPQIRQVGVLGTKGTHRSRLYDLALEGAGLEVVIPDPGVLENNIHATLYSPAFGIKACSSPVSEEASYRVRSAIRHLHDKGAGAVILGCTELPLAMKDSQVDGIPVIDPAVIIAERLISETCPDKLALSD